MLAIVGPSGSGKSTLLNLIGTLDRRNRRVRRASPDTTSPRCGPAGWPRARPRIGFVFQQFHLSTGSAPWRRADRAALHGDPPRERRDGPPTHWSAWAWGTGWTTARASCRAANASAWPSPVPWWGSRGCCSPTSPPATSTRPPAPRSSELLRELNHDRGGRRGHHPRPRDGRTDAAPGADPRRPNRLRPRGEASLTTLTRSTLRARRPARARASTGCAPAPCGRRCRRWASPSVSRRWSRWSASPPPARPCSRPSRRLGTNLLTVPAGTDVFGGRRTAFPEDVVGEIGRIPGVSDRGIPGHHGRGDRPP